MFTCLTLSETSLWATHCRNGCEQYDSSETSMDVLACQVVCNTILSGRLSTSAELANIVYRYSMSKSVTGSIKS